MLTDASDNKRMCGSCVGFAECLVVSLNQNIGLRTATNTATAASTTVWESFSSFSNLFLMNSLSSPDKNSRERRQWKYN